MDTLQALRQMLAASGLSPYRVAQMIGRHSSYVSQMLRRGSCPSADLLAEIAGACEYELQLVPLDGGAPLTIDGRAAPPAGAPPAG